MIRALFLALAGLLLAALNTACGRREIPSPSQEEVRAFLNHYFETWSSQDMDGYAACFHESARVTWLPQGREAPVIDTLADFLHGQRLGHQTAAEPMHEAADHIEILMDERAALARVRWTLIKGRERSTGIDHFSLARTPAGWRIMHLLVYSTP